MVLCKGLKMPAVMAQRMALLCKKTCFSKIGLRGNPSILDLSGLGSKGHS